MYRAAVENDRTHRVWAKHHALHVRYETDYGVLSANWACGLSPEAQVSCPCDVQENRFRKSPWLTKGGQWVNPRTYGERTRQEVRADQDFKEFLDELEFELEQLK